MRAAVSTPAHKASLSRTTSTKHATRPARRARGPLRRTAPPAPPWPLYRAATAGQAARRGSSSTPSLESATSAAQTVSAARQTSRRASAVCVSGVKWRGLGCMAITASPTVLRDTTAITEPASDAIHRVMAAVGRGLSSVRPARPAAFCCPRVSALQNVLSVTMTMVTRSVKCVTASA